MVEREPRRMPAPWRVEEIPGGFMVSDADSKVLAYIYASDIASEIDRGILTGDEARRVAAGIARLPELLARETATKKAPATGR
ncbi:MAG: hypothetical protein ABL908_15995 [Hyphomicrobium sp.]